MFYAKIVMHITACEICVFYLFITYTRLFRDYSRVSVASRSELNEIMQVLISVTAKKRDRKLREEKILGVRRYSKIILFRG